MNLLSQSHKKLLFRRSSQILLLLILLMTVGTVFDLQIAEFVGAAYRGFWYFAFGVTFEVLGFLPAILVNACLFATLGAYAKTQPIKILFHVLCAKALLGAVFCAVFWTMANHSVDVRTSISVPISLTVGAVLSFPFMKFFRRFDEMALKRLIYLLTIGLVMGTLANLATGVLQVFWGRYRFFEVTENSLPFTQWFQPFGRSEAAQGHGATSFPSLHASSVASMIILPLASMALEVKASTKKRLTILAVVMIVAVSLSRMILRWHYLTDVTFSLIIATIAFIMAVLIIDGAFGAKFQKFINNRGE